MKQNIHRPLPSFVIPLSILFVSVIAILSFHTYREIEKNTASQGEFHGQRVTAPTLSFGDVEDAVNILGDQTELNKHIEVDLSSQRVYAYDGATKVMDYTVSTGKWGRTPTGEFKIERKVRAQTMAGGNKAIGTYYYLPNVPWVQFFGNKEIPWSRGFSFHGTYWHSNFGHPMSHGCINMKTEDAQALYEWAPMGTRVTIYGTTPTS